GRWLTAVGRLALSNYLLQTFICATLFYGFGLGLYGQLDRASLLLIVLGIWVAQVVFSLWWLTHFRIGPFEWTWRRLGVKSLLARSAACRWIPLARSEERRVAKVSSSPLST